MTSPGIRPGVARLFHLPVRRPHLLAADVDDEIRFHLECRAEQLVRQGLTPERARAEAARRFGSLEEARRRLHHSAISRDHRMEFQERVDMLRRDVRGAFRSFRRTPGFVAVAVLTLALGIGANAAIFSVVNAVLLKALPFAAPGELVRVWPDGAAPPGIYEIIRTRSQVYRGIAGYEPGRDVSLVGTGDPLRLTAAQVTANLFSVLGVRPALGRGFVDGDNTPGRDRIVLLSDGLWRDRFGADPRVLGRRVTIDGVSRTIVGVMPPGVRFPAADVQLWTPAPFAPATPGYWWIISLRLVGRLKPGVTVAQARAEAAVLFDRARDAFPMKMPEEWGRHVDVVPLQETVVGAARPTLLLLLGAVGLVLLLACVNVAILYANRAAAREREIAVRAALGAGRGRIVAQLLTESLIVAAIGGVAGLALSALAVRVLVTLLPAGTPRIDEIGIDGRVLIFTGVLAVLSGIAFGLLPALRAARQDVYAGLMGSGRTGGVAARAAPRALAVAQVALAVTLVAGAGLLIKSFWRLHQVELGFRTEQVLAADVPLPSFPRDTAARAPIFYDALIERLSAIPGVRGAAAASTLPFGGGSNPAAMEIEAHPTSAGGVPPTPQLAAVTPNYFRVMSIPLLRGRNFTEADREGTTRVGLIDAAAASKFWPNENPLGQRIRYVWNPDWITIVGVVGNVKRDSLSSATEPSLYLPMRQSFPQGMRLVIRAAATDISTLAPAVRAAVAAVDPTVPVSDVRPLAGVVAESAARPRFATVLLALFAAIALLLGALGIYGVMGAAVARRTREIGVRVALGATGGEVLRMVLRESATITAAGTILGLAGALAAARVLRGLLFGVGAIDPLVLATIPFLLGAVAVCASLVPARRAARVEPLVAIRTE